MTFHMIGCHHRTTSLEVRERLAFAPNEITAALLKWGETFTGIEAVLLSTCNRTELYYAAEEGELPERDAVTRFLLEARGLKGEAAVPVASQLELRKGGGVVAHLFRVAASLDSMVLGESQILAQVKAAYQRALEVGTTGPLMHGVFQAALKVAKRVAAETSIQQYRLSIPSVAVADFVLRLFEHLSERSALVLGAGEMAEETIRYLRTHGMERIMVTNRSRPRAESLAAALGGEVIDWNNRFTALVEVDLAVGTTGAPQPILTCDNFMDIESQRRNRPLFLLDLAVPRDFASDLADRPAVYLYSLDDLTEVCEANRRRRDREMPKAERIIEKETEIFFRDMNHRKTGDLIRQLRQSWETTKGAELDRLLKRIDGIDEHAEKEIRYAFDRLVNKLIHPPLESLRDESRQEVPHGLLDALARLFHLR